MRNLTVLYAAFSVALASPALAQMMPANQPPASPVIVTPPQPSTCDDGTQLPSCPPSHPPPAPSPAPRPGLVSGFSVGGSTAGMQKVVSYFQRGSVRIDTTRAFGFVLMPRAAVTAEDRAVQRRFCEVTLASLDYMAPDSETREQVLMTYWPISTVVERWQIDYAFRNRRCDDLIDWYDHSLARSIANKADIAHLSGPLLITWPSQDPDNSEARSPLIVDFARADDAHATKALKYWFRQLNNAPELWTNRIREGTIRAELADAINDTAGVVLAVLHGKWESVAAVSDTP